MDGAMLKITVQDTPKQLTLKLEGSLVGAWVLEVECAWRSSNAELANRLLCLDLIEVDQIDDAGRYLLVLLHERGVRLVATSLVMTEIVGSITQDWPLKKRSL
ncbi:hypothetical protein [Tunturiibacter gelidiferens]|uniref:hypothetical protein n=1 Tax=Tunturiibacter gelidiferens TaxID=3069689 RepID=UPI003D9BC223